MTIFISYRRIDTQQAAGRLADRLMKRFGPDAVVIDVATDQVGRDYRTLIFESLEDADVVLALVGPRFLVEAEDGSLRIDDPDDPLRLELARALARRQVPVIPVLVDGAELPRREDLPEDVQDLTFRGAIELAHQRFDRDYEYLEGQVARYLEPVVPPGGSVTGPVSPVPDDTTHPAAAPDVASADDRREIAGTAAVVAAGDEIGAEASTSAADDPAGALPRSPGRSARWRWVWIAAAAVIAAGVVGGVVVMSDDGSAEPGEVASTDPSSTEATTTVPSATTSAVRAASTTLRPRPVAIAPTSPPVTTSPSLVFPTRDDIYEQPPEDAVALLEALGYAVVTNNSGCSNSTPGGLVRQLTAGTTLNQDIIYGKSTDPVDEQAAADLRPGDLVTVWVSAGPC